jgi:two-component system OmpR family response regulator
MRLLVVEDDPKLGGLLRRGLSENANAADLASCGEDALWMAKAHNYDAIVLDVMLPGMDGFQTCARLRSDGCWAPVLMLTARDAVEDRIEGLDSGADDYLTKPFSIAELRARLRALVRRGASERPAILELFMRRAGEVLSRYQLLEHAWDMAYDNRSNVVTVHIRRLREKIDRPFERSSIETVRGAGYRMRTDGGT